MHSLVSLRVHPTTTKVTPGHSLLEELAGPPQAPSARPVPMTLCEARVRAVGVNPAA